MGRKDPRVPLQGGSVPLKGTQDGGHIRSKSYMMSKEQMVCTVEIRFNKREYRQILNQRTPHVEAYQLILLVLANWWVLYGAFVPRNEMDWSRQGKTMHVFHLLLLHALHVSWFLVYGNDKNRHYIYIFPLFFFNISDISTPQFYHEKTTYKEQKINKFSLWIRYIGFNLNKNDWEMLM
jgi:hypothetical protein